MATMNNEAKETVKNCRPMSIVVAVAVDTAAADVRSCLSPPLESVFPRGGARILLKVSTFYAQSDGVGEIFSIRPEISKKFKFFSILGPSAHACLKPSLTFRERAHCLRFSVHASGQ